MRVQTFWAKKRYFKIIWPMLFLLSCGQTGVLDPNNTSLLFAGSITEGGIPYSEQEQGIAYRVCFALRAKRFHFQMDDSEEVGEGQSIKKRHAFETQKSSCENSEVSLSEIGNEKTVLSLLNDNESGQLNYHYIEGSVLFHQVLTDQQGPLREICEDVLQGKRATNVYQQDDAAFELNFLSTLEGDQVLIKRGKASPNEQFEYEVESIEQYHVLTDAMSSGELLGFVHYSKRTLRCANNSFESITHRYYEE